MESSILRSGASVLKEVQEALAELGDKEVLKNLPFGLEAGLEGIEMEILM